MRIDADVAPVLIKGKRIHMKVTMTKIVRVISITAVLLLNVACANSNNANVWSNSDYGSGTTSAPKYVKTVSGLALMN